MIFFRMGWLLLFLQSPGIPKARWLTKKRVVGYEWIRKRRVFGYVINDVKCGFVVKCIFVLQFVL